MFIYPTTKIFPVNSNEHPTLIRVDLFAPLPKRVFLKNFQLFDVTFVACENNFRHRQLGIFFLE